MNRLFEWSAPSAFPRAAKGVCLALALAILAGGIFGIDSRAADAPAEAPRVTVRKFLDEARGWGEARKVRVEGVVSASLSDRTFFIQSDDAGVYVFAKPDPPLVVGTRVEVTGRPSLGGVSPTLQDASVVNLGPGERLPVRETTAAGVIQEARDMVLVRLRGRLTAERLRGPWIWIVNAGGTNAFIANLEAIPEPQKPTEVTPGSLLELTGVCSLRFGPDRRAASFQLFVRDAGDIRVMAGPPWWSGSRAASVVGAVIGILMLTFLWVWSLRRRVAARTEELARQLRRLAALETRYRELFRANPQPMWVHELETLRFLAVNEAAVHHYGYTEREFLRLTLHDIRPSERDAGTISDGFDTAGIEVHRKKSGEEIEVEIASHGLVFDGLRAELVLAHDVTARRRVEAALRESEAYRRTIIETEPECVKVLDDRGGVLEMNPAGLAFLEVDSLAELRCHPLGEFVLPAYRDAFMDLHRRVMAGGSGTLEFEILGAKGTGRWLETHAVPFRYGKGAVPSFLGITRDVTARKSAELELRRSQEQFATVFRACPDGILIVREVDHRIVALNPAFERLGGIPAAEAVGRTTIELGLWDDPSQRHAVLEDLRGSGSITNCELQLRRRNREVMTVLASAERITFGGEPCMLSLIRDITERRQAEQERRALEIKLLQTQKLESLGVLSGGIAHDFNNLLTAVMGNLGLALMDLDPASAVRQPLLEAETATRRAADLARQILAYSGKGPFVVQRVRLAEVVEEMTQMLRVSISKKAVLRCRFDRGVPPVKVDVTQLRQVILNLVTNASEAIGERDGVIDLSTGAMDCDRAYLSTTWLSDSIPEGRYAFLEVADSGSGIPRELLPRIFEPFFTTKFTGRGLGLSAVLGIVRGHRGALKVDTELGRGTTFRVLLPVSEGPVDVAPASASGGGDLAGRGLILLVDDEESIRSIGRRMIERMGFQVVTAADGVAALEIVRTVDDPIACVLLDLTMPRMDGEETFRRLRQIRPGLPVVLSSGFSEHDVIRRFSGEGPTGFVAKPYSFSHLHAALARAIFSAGGESTVAGRDPRS